MVDENNVKQGFLTNSRIQDHKTPPPGYLYNPFTTNKSINLPQGVITYIYESVNTDTVVVKPVYEAGFKNSTIIREIISVVDKLVKRKLIIEYDKRDALFFL